MKYMHFRASCSFAALAEIMESYGVDAEDYLASNPNMTAADLSLKTGFSSRAIEKNIKKLKDCGLLIRHGSTKAGYREVLSKSNQI